MDKIENILPFEVMLIEMYNLEALNPQSSWKVAGYHVKRNIDLALKSA